MKEILIKSINIKFNIILKNVPDLTIFFIERINLQIWKFSSFEIYYSSFIFSTFILVFPLWFSFCHHLFRTYCISPARTYDGKHNYWTSTCQSIIWRRPCSVSTDVRSNIHLLKVNLISLFNVFLKKKLKIQMHNFCNTKANIKVIIENRKSGWLKH